MNSMKLEYLLNNNKKLQLQKRFLEKALNKNLEDLGTMMQKADLEVARESFISAKQAQQRLQQMFTFSRDSLAYVKDIVLFMKFDVGEQIQGNPTQKDMNEPEVELPKRPQDEVAVDD